MKKLISFIFIAFLISCSGVAQKSEKKIAKKYAVSKTASEWKKQLTSLQYYVLREAGTERSFTSSLNENKKNGLYVCAACETPLYDSDHKFDSGTGLTSFDRGIEENLEYDVDFKIVYPRSELKCNTCGGHLGHMFKDGPPQTTGLRHCINSAALNFISKNEFENLIQKNEFYEYAKIFENYYGTHKESIDLLSKTNDIIFDIDWQGTKQLSNFKELKLIKIFLIPPDKKELKKMLYCSLVLNQ
mgnify:CR=1 FL=1